MNLSAGEQHQPPFSEMSPNHKIPLLVDEGAPIFESGAILIHLADKTGQLLPASGAARSTVLVGLCGVLMMIRRVLPVTAAATLAHGTV